MSMHHCLKELQEQKRKYINLAMCTGIPPVCTHFMHVPAPRGQTLSAITTVCPAILESRRLGSIIQIHCSCIINMYLHIAGMPRQNVVVISLLFLLLSSAGQYLYSGQRKAQSLWCVGMTLLVLSYTEWRQE